MALTYVNRVQLVPSGGVSMLIDIQTLSGHTMAVCSAL